MTPTRIANSMNRQFSSTSNASSTASTPPAATQRRRRRPVGAVVRTGGSRSSVGSFSPNLANSSGFSFHSSAHGGYHGGAGGGGAASVLTATQRFFAVPELLYKIASYAELERVDLLALAAVSPALRTIALQHWVHKLDIPLSRAHHRLNFLTANPLLFGHIRHIRIRNDIAQARFDLASTTLFTEVTLEDASSRPEPRWADLKLILAMVAAQPSCLLRPPTLDITIGITEARILLAALQPFPRLHQRIAALRIMPDVDTYAEAEEEQEEYINNWDDNWDRLALLLQKIYEAAHEPAEQHEGATDIHLSGVSPASVPNRLEQLVLADDEREEEPDDHNTGGLRAFHFGHTDVDYEDYEWTPPAIPLSFFQTLSDSSSSTLRDLSLTLAGADLPDDIFPLLEHDRLRVLFLKRSASGPIDALEDFLDQNQATIEDLTLDIGDPSEPLSLRQNFPRLAYSRIWSKEYTSTSAQRERDTDFAKRHPHVLETAHEIITSGQSYFPDGIYPNLRVLSSDTSVNEEFARQRADELPVQGGTKEKQQQQPYGLALLRTQLDLASLQSSWLATVPGAGAAVTALELIYRRDTIWNLKNHFASAFDADGVLPNLTELAITYANNGSGPFSFLGSTPATSFLSGAPTHEHLSEMDIGEILKTLVRARSLRILRLHDQREVPLQRQTPSEGPSGTNAAQTHSTRGGVNAQDFGGGMNEKGAGRRGGIFYGVDGDDSDDDAETGYEDGDLSTDDEDDWFVRPRSKSKKHPGPGPGTVFNADTDEFLLDDFDSFPPALEYLVWSVPTLGQGRRHFYRVVPYVPPLPPPSDATGAEDASPPRPSTSSDPPNDERPSGLVSTGSDQSAPATGTSPGRRGRLQRIPSHFCTRVTADGLWEHTCDFLQSNTVLDHTTSPEVGPVLRLS
ncbi:hypothetical protein V8E36_008511 [Tilletia maclaganii]